MTRPQGSQGGSCGMIPARCQTCIVPVLYKGRSSLPWKQKKLVHARVQGESSITFFKFKGCCHVFIYIYMYVYNIYYIA